MGQTIFIDPLDFGWHFAYCLCMQHGSLQLTAWLKRSKLDQREGAKVLKMHYTTLNKLLTMKRLPGREAAIELEEKTGIPVAAWTTVVGKAKKPKRRFAKTVNVDRVPTHASAS